jgi:hypothetical protein
LRISCMAQMPTATPVAANSGYTWHETKSRVTKITGNVDPKQTKQRFRWGEAEGETEGLEEGTDLGADPPLGPGAGGGHGCDLVSHTRRRDGSAASRFSCELLVAFLEEDGFTARLVFYRRRRVLTDGSGASRSVGHENALDSLFFSSPRLFNSGGKCGHCARRTTTRTRMWTPVRQTDAGRFPTCRG